MSAVKHLPRLRPRHPNDLAPARPDSFFLVDLVSVSLRELVPHLEHPFFGLSKIPERGIRRYEDEKGQYLQLEPGPRGLPTIFDQDFVIYATSVLMAERRRLEENPLLKGERRVSDDGIVRFSTADFAGIHAPGAIRTQSGRRSVQQDRGRIAPSDWYNAGDQHESRRLPEDGPLRDDRPRLHAPPRSGRTR